MCSLLRRGTGSNAAQTAWYSEVCSQDSANSGYTKRQSTLASTHAHFARCGTSRLTAAAQFQRSSRAASTFIGWRPSESAQDAAHLLITLSCTPTYTSRRERETHQECMRASNTTKTTMNRLASRTKAHNKSGPRVSSKYRARVRRTRQVRVSRRRQTGVR